MADYLSFLSDLQSSINPTLKQLSKLPENLPKLEIPKQTNLTTKPKDTNTASKNLAGYRSIQGSLGGLADLTINKGQNLLNAVGEAQKSFYQGKIPDQTLAKIASPTAGAGTGYALGSTIGSFLPNPVWKAGATALGTLAGAGLGALGSTQLTPDQKKAAQIRSEEAGFEKMFSDPKRWGTEAISTTRQLPEFLLNVGTGGQKLVGSVASGVAKGLKEYNIPVLKEYGDVLNKVGKNIQNFSEEERKFYQDKINYASNIPFKPKNEQDGFKRVKDLPLNVIQNLSPEAVKAMVKGDNLDKLSIPQEIHDAYDISQRSSAQEKIIREFTKQGKSPEEIQKLVSFGMAGIPLEGVAQSFASDPTMLLDPAIALGKVSKGVSRANKFKSVQNERALTQLNRAKSSIENPQTGQLSMKGLIDNKGIKNLSEELLPISETLPKQPEIINTIENPNQTKIDFDQELAPPNFDEEISSIPKQQPNLEQDINNEIQNLVDSGLDIDSLEGDEQLIQNLMKKGYDESEILSTLDQKLNITNPTENITNTYKSFYEPNYINPTESDIYNTLREGVIPGLDENADLGYKLTKGGGLPIGFYENEKLVPIYDDIERGIKKRLPVKFEFSSPLEKEIFTKYGGDYVDWLRESALENIKVDKGIESTATAHKVLTDTQKQERFKDLGRRLLLGTSDPTYIDNLNLPKEAKKEFESLEEEFIKKIYSGGSKANKGTKSEGVIGHVPNSIRKDLLKQIESKFELTGKTPAEKKEILQKLKPEDLENITFSPQSKAYTGLIEKTKEFRNKFQTLLNKYKPQ